MGAGEELLEVPFLLHLPDKLAPHLLDTVGGLVLVLPRESQVAIVAPLEQGLDSVFFGDDRHALAGHVVGSRRCEEQVDEEEFPRSKLLVHAVKPVATHDSRQQSPVCFSILDGVEA